MAEQLYIYRWRKYGTHFTGRRCKVLARGKMNSAMVEFENGERAVCSRNALRKVDNYRDFVGAAPNFLQGEKPEDVIRRARGQ